MKHLNPPPISATQLFLSQRIHLYHYRRNQNIGQQYPKLCSNLRQIKRPRTLWRVNRSWISTPVSRSLKGKSTPRSILTISQLEIRQYHLIPPSSRYSKIPPPRHAQNSQPSTQPDQTRSKCTKTLKPRLQQKTQLNSNTSSASTESTSHLFNNLLKSSKAQTLKLRSPKSKYPPNGPTETSNQQPTRLLGKRRSGHYVVTQPYIGGRRKW